MGIIAKVFKERGVVSPTTPPTRVWNPGHYIRAGSNDITTWGNQWLTNGVLGFAPQHTWKELEPQKNQYDGLNPTNGPIAKELQWCLDNSVRYVLMLTDRTFSGGKNASPIPSYFGDPAPVGNPTANIYSQQYNSNQGAVGVMLARHNNDDTGGIPGLTVRDRLKKLLDQIGDLCDGHPAFEGLYFQETALGFDAGQKAAVSYTAEAYRDFYIDILTYAANALPQSRIFWCLNYIPATGGGHSNELADDVLSAVKPLNAIVFGGPDCLPESSGLKNEEYQYMGSSNFTLNGVTCHGYKNKIPVAIQVSPPGYAIKWNGADPLPARYWTLEELYQFCNDTDSHWGNALHASYMFWYAVNGSSGTADTDLGPPYNGWKGGAAYATPTGQQIASSHPTIFNYTGPR